VGNITDICLVGIMLLFVGGMDGLDEAYSLFSQLICVRMCLLALCNKCLWRCVSDVLYLVFNVCLAR
jgi:hypothetical protein